MKSKHTERVSSATVSESTRKRNPHLFGDLPRMIEEAVQRNRTCSPTTDEDGLNKLEKAWLAKLRATYHPSTCRILIQAITLKLADRVRYTPDFLVIFLNGGAIHAHETKGPYCREDARIKLKVAARMYPWIQFYLVTRPKGGEFEAEQVNP